MKLVILDRDGVINYDSDEYIKNPDEFIPLPGSLEAIARLTKAGYTVVVATNQSGVGRGLFDLETLHAMHDKMNSAVAMEGGKIEAVFYCPHTPEDHCDCRKPKTGLLQQIAARFHLDLNGVPVIGDSLRDIQSAQTMEARPMLVRTGKGERTVAKGEGLTGVPIYADLSAAVDALLGESKS